MLLLLATGVAAAQTRPQAQKPAHAVVIQPSASQQRFRQAVRQSQVSDQLRKNQVENNLRQQSIELTRRPADGSDPNDRQVDSAQTAQDRLYQARQRDQMQRYNEALMPQPVPQPQPASDTPPPKKDADGK